MNKPAHDLPERLLNEHFRDIKKHRGSKASVDRLKSFISKMERATYEQGYRNGYNDNARDCTCENVNLRGFTGKTIHRHLLDDGKSHNIRPDISHHA